MTILIRDRVNRKIVVHRFVAYFIDMTLLMIAVQSVQWGLFILTDGFPFNQLALSNSGILIYGWVFLTVSIPIWLYFILQERSVHHATIGKRIMGLVVESQNGEPANLGQIISRTVIKLLSWEIFHLTFMFPTPLVNDPSAGFRIGFVVGYLILILYVLVLIQTPLYQSVHDLIARTVVRKK